MKVNPFKDTPEEKKQKIADMIQEGGYSFKDIVKECHVSLTTVSQVKKRLLGYTEDEIFKQALKSSKESQAYRFFQEGKSIIDTKIELDIPFSEVVEYHKTYQELLSRDGFNTAYNSVSGNIVPFLNLFNLMNSLHMTPEQVAEAVKYRNALPQLQNMHSTLSNEVRALESQKLTLSTQVNLLGPQAEEYIKSLDYYNNECQLKRNELLALNSEINAKKTFIQNLDNDEGYTRIKKAAAEQTKQLMQDNTVLLGYTVSATLEALRRYPYSEELLCDLLATQDNSTSLDKQSPISYHKSELFKLARQVEEELAQQITNVTMNNIQARNDE